MLVWKEYGEDEQGEWDAFLAASPGADFMQSWGWGNVKAGFPVWQVKRLGWERKGELVAVAQILRRKLPLGFSLLYIPRGPMLDWRDKDIVREVLVSLTSWARHNSWKGYPLVLRLEPPTERSAKLEELLISLGFRPYFKTVQPARTLLIDLERGQDELLKSFRRTARNLIYRCDKEGIRVDVHRGQDISAHLKEFIQFYGETARRFAFPKRALRQFELLVGECAPRGQLRLYQAHGREGEILASGLVTLAGSRAFYIWGGSTRRHPLAKFASYGYIWGMLTDLQKIGVKTFDFWGLAPEGDARHPWAGFTLFKTAFDGKPFDYAPAFDLPLSPLYPVFKLIDRLTTPRYRATAA